MSENYILVEFRQRELPGFALVNAGLQSADYRPRYVWHLSILIACNDLVGRRLPSPDEQATLNEFEDKIAPIIEAGSNAVFLARVTHDGLRELIWRVHDPEPANAMLQHMIQTKGHPREFDYRIDRDAGWKKAAWYLDRVRKAQPTLPSAGSP